MTMLVTSGGRSTSSKDLPIICIRVASDDPEATVGVDLPK